jgi:hypothetical protein
LGLNFAEIHILLEGGACRLNPIYTWFLLTLNISSLLSVFSMEGSQRWNSRDSKEKRDKSINKKLWECRIMTA